MSEKLKGYGDPQCQECKILELFPELEARCREMVGYTRLEIMAANQLDIESAGRMEHEQNKIAIELNSIIIDGEAGNCEPGKVRI